MRVSADLANWLLLLLCFTDRDMSARDRSTILCVCAGVNFICMMLDCFDGMHARATKQTSKLGEVLDHWLDAFHVPLVGAGVCYALNVPDWALASIHVANAALYCSQLVVYHYTRIFHPTAGTEAQITASVLYLVAALLVVWHPNVVSSTHEWYSAVITVHWVVHNVFSVITLFVDGHLTWAFCKRFDSVMTRGFAGMSETLSIVCLPIQLFMRCE